MTAHPLECSCGGSGLTHGHGPCQAEPGPDHPAWIHRAAEPRREPRDLWIERWRDYRRAAPWCRRPDRSEIVQLAETEAEAGVVI